MRAHAHVVVVNLAVQRLLRRPKSIPSGLHPIGLHVAPLMHRAGVDLAIVEAVALAAMDHDVQPWRPPQ